jgi:hypothetical protein
MTKFPGMVLRSTCTKASDVSVRKTFSLAGTVGLKKQCL